MMKPGFIACLVLAGMFLLTACDKKAEDTKTEASPQVSYEKIAKDAEELFRGYCECDMLARQENKAEELKLCRRVTRDIEKAFNRKYDAALKDKETSDKIEALSARINQECDASANTQE